MYLADGLRALRPADPHARPLPLLLLALTAAVIGAALLLAAAGASLAVSLIVLALSPWVTVVGYELVGHRHNADVLAAL